jgi:Leucine-rich repeat (LRR) protein
MKITQITGYHAGYHPYRKNNRNVEKVGFNRHLWSNFLPNGFGGFFPNLLEFEVQGTPLKTLKRSNFEEMTNLIVLTLENTKLSHITDDAFFHLTNLQELIINESFMTNFHPNIFIPLKMLNLFSAKYNKLTTLHSNLFNENQKLESINFIGNNFEDINLNFTKLENIAEIYLLKCGCINSYYVKENFKFTLPGLQNLIFKKCSPK